MTAGCNSIWQGHTHIQPLASDSALSVSWLSLVLGVLRVLAVPGPGGPQGPGAPGGSGSPWGSWAGVIVVQATCVSLDQLVAVLGPAPSRTWPGQLEGEV